MERVDMDREFDLDPGLLARVWKRVEVEAAEPPASDREVPREAAALGAFIRRAAGAGGMYERLARRTRGTRAQKELLALARQERMTERELQARRLVLFGDTLALPPAGGAAPALLRALKESMDAELANAAAYEAAAAATGEESLRGLYQKLAGRERRHTGVLRGILERAVYG